MWTLCDINGLLTWLQCACVQTQFLFSVLFPPPPPTPLKPQMKVDFVWMWIPHMGNARNLRYSLASLRGARRGHAGISFSTWACASRRQAPSSFVHHAGGRRRFRLGVSSSVGHCCQHFWVGLVTQPNKGRTSPWQMPAGQAGVANISWSASAGRRWCCCVQGFQNSTSLLLSCGKSLFWMCMALVTSINMAGGACKCGVGSLVHRRKFDRSHSDAAVLCAAALVFPSLRQDLRNNQTNAGSWSRRIWHGRAFQPFVLLSWTYLRLGSTCKSRLSKQASRRTNQLHVNPRDSISGFLQSRFTNNEQKNWTNAEPQAGVWSTVCSSSQQVTKVRTHAHMQSLACPRTHGTNACLATHHFYLLGIQ